MTYWFNNRSKRRLWRFVLYFMSSIIIHLHTWNHWILSRENNILRSRLSFQFYRTEAKSHWCRCTCRQERTSTTLEDTHFVNNEKLPFSQHYQLQLFKLIFKPVHKGYRSFLSRKHVQFCRFYFTEEQQLWGKDLFQGILRKSYCSSLAKRFFVIMTYNCNALGSSNKNRGEDLNQQVWISLCREGMTAINSTHVQK